jgi:hypothetical protein
MFDQPERAPDDPSGRFEVYADGGRQGIESVEVNLGGSTARSHHAGEAFANGAVEAMSAVCED